MAGYPDSHDPHITEVEAYMQGLTAEGVDVYEVRLADGSWMLATANDLKTCLL